MQSACDSFIYPMPCAHSWAYIYSFKGVGNPPIAAGFKSMACPLNIAESGMDVVTTVGYAPQFTGNPSIEKCPGGKKLAPAKLFIDAMNNISVVVTRMFIVTIPKYLH